MYQEIYIIEDNETLINKLNKIFKCETEYTFINVKPNDLLEDIKTIPDLIIVDEDEIYCDAVEVCNCIRKNNENAITPIMVLSSNVDKEHRINILKSNVEYFIKSPMDDEYIYYTIKNIIRLMSSNRKVSPLTGLPGNTQIQVEIKKRLLKKEEFSILYFDLDNFKEYNDIYGFLKGDEVIKFTAKTIQKIVLKHKTNNAFVGHVGGDDFVAIVSSSDYEKICQDIIAVFDSHIKEYFNEEDINKGYLEVENRRGIIEQFPITAISIGVVKVQPGEYENPLEIGEVGAQVKHLAKTQIGSAYAINRRKRD